MGDALALFHLGAFEALQCVLVPFIGYGDLALEPQHAFPQFGCGMRTVVARLIRRGARCIRAVALTFGNRLGLVCFRKSRAQADHAFVQLGKLTLPRRHLTRGQCQFYGEPTIRDFNVTFSAFALPRQRADLRRDLRYQVIEPREVGGCLLEAAFGASSAVAVQAHAGRFLKELATIVGTIREQCIDHPTFDDDAAVGAEPGAAHKIVDVAQAARRIVQEVLALTGTRKAPRDHHFAEGNR